VTHIYDPAKGTFYPPPPPLENPKSIGNASLASGHTVSSQGTMGLGAKHLLGKLPKMNFSKFEGENPKLWKSRCESYFDMYNVDEYIWVKVASMHFEGPAARWLQSIDHRISKATWSELCSWIHERFAKDEHEIIIRQLYKIKQSGSVQGYIDKFDELVDQLKAYSSSIDPLYYTTRFVDGLKDEIKQSIIVQCPKDLDIACCLALLQVRMKTVGKILGFFGPVFHIFPIIFVLFRKNGKRYGNGIGCRRNRSGYGWASTPSVFVLGGKIW
jgi:hypothetical protein